MAAERDDTRPDVDEEGVIVREPYWEDEVDEQTKYNQVPGIWIGHMFGTAPDAIEIQEFGIDSMYPRDVVIGVEDIPQAVEAIVERAREEDHEEIRERVEAALERDWPPES